MSGVHLLCIKVSGKDATGVSRLACSSLKGYHQMRARGGRDMADDCIFYWGDGCGCTAGWHNTPGSQSKASAKQTTPINLVPLDASLTWSHSSTGCVSKVFRRDLARLRPALLHWPENRQRAKQYSRRLLENSLVTLLSSNYAKTQSLVPSFKTEEQLMDIITALTSHRELPFPHGILIRLFPAIDYKNESQVFEDNCRQGHCK